MARFCPMFSSSSGNCTYIGSGAGGLLVDAGVSAKKIFDTLTAIDVDINDIGAIFVTHEHSDHINGLRVFATRYNIPVYTSSGTLKKLDECGIYNEKYKIDVIPQDGIECRGMFVRAFKTSHDSAESVGYTVETPDERKISVATDTGYVTEETMEAVKGSDLVLAESNHDIGMLENGPYQYWLKRRILSDVGHLSNDSCSEFAVELIKTGTTRLFLGHLSKENNMPALAYETTNSALKCAGADEDKDYILKVAGVGIPKMEIL